MLRAEVAAAAQGGGRGLGKLEDPELISAAVNQASVDVLDLCEKSFPVRSEINACRAGAFAMANGMSRLLANPEFRSNVRARLKRALNGTGQELGLFASCAVDCDKGFEKVILRRPGTRNDEDSGVCICRLDVDHRRKFTGPEYKDMPESRRRPFGKEAKPVHLRRRSRRFLPGVITRDIPKRGE